MHESKLENLTEDDKIRADLATGIMMAVQATGVLEGVGDATVTYATAVLREEVKTFCDPQGAYGEALREVRKGTMTEGDALAMVVATCVEKIAVFKETGLN